ncbi:MAG: S8 family serine peptidase [Acidimicrobiia bacterium]
MNRYHRALVPVLATFLLTVACASEATPDPGVVSTAPDSTLESPPTTLGLSTAEVVLPEEGSLIETVEWGVVPANLVDVLLVDGSGADQAEEVAEAIGGEIVGSIELIAFYQIKIEGTTEADLTAALSLAEGQPSVEMATPELPMVAGGEASCVAQGALENSWFADAAQPANSKPYQAVGLEQAWAAAQASGVTLTPTRVGVIDTGLYTGSSELAGTVRITGTSAADTTNQPASDANGALTFGGLNHGTGVAHVIGADPSNGGMVGVASVLGSNLEISVTDVFTGPHLVAATPKPDDLTQVDYGASGAWSSSILAAMLNQVKQGSTVINLSLGASTEGADNRPMAAATRRMLEAIHKSHPRVVFVAAAGNHAVGLDGSNQYPGGAPLPNLITVGAVDSDGSSATFTNFALPGGEVTIAAPGVQVPMGIGADGKPYHSDGTSFSAPMVAGAVAMLQSLDPGLTATQIKDILKATAATEVKEGDKTTTIAANLGGGILRVDKAVLQVINEIRAKGANPKPPLDWDTIEALAGITATAEGTENDSHTVTAAVGAVSEGGTSLVVTLLSDGSISGNATQTLTAAGSATWTVDLNGGFGDLSVQRTDSGVGCILSVKLPQVDGLWVGSMVVTSVEVTGDEVQFENPDGTVTVMTKEECEAALSANQDPIPIEYTFATTSPGVGTVSGTTDQSGGSPTGSWLLVGQTISFEMAAPDQPMAVTYEGTVGEGVIEGTWETSNEDMVLKGTFSMVPGAPK